MTAEETNYVALLLTNAWPLVTLVGIFALREQLGVLLTSLGSGLKNGRALKLGFAGVSVELGAVVTQDSEAVALIADLGYVSAAQMESSGRELVRSVTGGDPVEAITIDLKSGNGFLTSRLFLTAALMSRQRALRVVAFVHDANVKTDQYLGACLVEDLLRALVHAFPEYEAALDMAIHQQWWCAAQPGVVQVPGAWTPPIANSSTPTLGAAGQFPESAAARIFGGALESLRALPPPSAAPPPGFVALKDNYLERAEWVTGAWLKAALGNALMVDQTADGPDAAKRVLACRNAYVGLVDEAGRLVRIISRTRLVERALKVHPCDLPR